MASEWRYWNTTEPGPRALEFWRDAVCAGVLNSEFNAPQNDAFSGSMSSLHHGAARLVKFASSPHSIKRSQQLVHQLDSDHIMLSLQVKGRALISQSNTEICLDPGQFALLDSAAAFDIRFPEETARRLVLLPREWLATRAPSLRRLKAPRKLAASSLYTSVLSETMCLLTNGSMTLDERIANTLLDTVAEIVATECGEIQGAVSTELTYAQVKRHIDTSIADPALAPSTVAAACRISVRTLHRLFARHADQSFESYVVQARLALAHQLLSAGRASTVSEAAFACGFNNLSHFSRRFSERYGELPVALLRRYQPTPRT